jgi:DNA-binding NarL/FixJ family response regulator
MKPIRIVLVDAQHLFRSSLADFLTSAPETQVVAQFCTGEAAICQVGVYQPDIVLTEIQLPDMDGLAVIKQLAQNQLAIGILVLSHLDSKRNVWAAIQAGAKGYLLKKCSKPELLTAIISVAHGQVVLGAQVVNCVEGLPVPPMIVAAGYIDHPMSHLTKRERQILVFIGQGLSNEAIACKLAIQKRSVEFHVTNIFKKLNVASRVEAAVLWARYTHTHPASLSTH